MVRVIDLNYEVVVVGGGMAGISAALASSINGAKTILIERHPYAGGAFTAGMVIDIAGIVDHRRLGSHHKICFEPDRWIVKGLAVEYYKRLSQYGATYGLKWDHEVAKIIFDKMLREYNVDVLYGTQFFTAHTKDRKISAIEAYFRTNKIVVEGKIFVDATGDGDVGAEAGVEFYFGRESDGKMSPGTLSHMIADVDTEAESIFEINHMLREAATEGKISSYMRPAIIGPRYAEGKERREIWWSVVRQWGKFTDPIEYSRMEQDGRFVGWEIFRFVKENTQAYRDSYIASASHQLWPREGRHLDTEYKITADDVRNCARFDDVIARGGFYLDVHSVEPGNIGFDLDEHRAESDTYFEIPYRALLPKGVDNLLLAGRTIGATHEGYGATRVMGTGIATGQAAGTTAAILVKQKLTTRKINIQELQTTLRDQNVEI